MVALPIHDEFSSAVYHEACSCCCDGLRTETLEEGLMYESRRVMRDTHVLGSHVPFYSILLPKLS